MTRALLLSAVLLGGCLIVPSKQTSTRPAGTETGKTTFAKSREVTLESKVDGSTLHVQAKRIGECTQPVYAISDVTTKKHARLGGASDPRAIAFGILLAPITIPVSAVITGFIVASDSPQTTRQVRPLGRKQFACSLEADRLTVKIALPSGAVVERMTSRDGRVELEIPETEPYAGAIVVTAPTAPPLEVAYTVPKPAVTTARDAVTSCAAQHRISGDVTAKLSINDTGRTTRVWLSAGDAAFNACVGKQLAGVRFAESAHDSTLSMRLVLSTTAASL